MEHDIGKGMQMRLEGKTAVVTGGARGIGKAYALRLAGEGARVVLADVLDASGAVREIQERGGAALALHTDVTDEQSVLNMVTKTVERFQTVDILVNNAAIFADVVKRSFFEMPVEEWDRMMAVNLRGTFLCCKAVYPQMKKQKKGKIINISSSTILSGNPLLLAYVTSKGGILAFTRALAREAGDDGICVNAIAPGFTVSDAIKENPTFPEQTRAMIRNSRCFKRDEESQDVTGTVLFLASDDSDFITGQTIVVDGGGVFH